VSSTKLGDWYANLLFTRPIRLVLCVSEKTLLPVLLPARDLAGIGKRIAPAVAEMLRAIGIPEKEITSETSAMEPVVFARTASKRVLGTMNNFAYMLGFHLEGGDTPFEASLRLAQTPCTPALFFPDKATRTLFGVPEPPRSWAGSG
jgi:hypothetical protein